MSRHRKPAGRPPLPTWPPRRCLSCKQPPAAPAQAQQGGPTCGAAALGRRRVEVSRVLQPALAVHAPAGAAAVLACRREGSQASASRLRHGFLQAQQGAAAAGSRAGPSAARWRGQRAPGSAAGQTGGGRGSTRPTGRTTKQKVKQNQKMPHRSTPRRCTWVPAPGRQHSTRQRCP